MPNAARLPKHVFVGSRRYRLAHDLVALNVEAVRIGAKDGLYGYADNVAMTIYLDPQSGPARSRDTVVHELLHALMDFSGLDKTLGPDDEEEVALRLAPVLLDLLRANRKLVAYLTAE